MQTLVASFVHYFVSTTNGALCNNIGFGVNVILTTFPTLKENKGIVFKVEIGFSKNGSGFEFGALPS
jgi:hypothetical protein